MKTYKSIFKAIMVGTLACTTVGCAASDNEPKAEKEENTEKQQETKNVIPTEIMSKEETLELTEGTTIELKDLKKMPDEAVLEENDKTIVYIVEENAFDSSNKKVESHIFKHGTLEDEIKNNGESEKKVNNVTIVKKLQGIEIVGIEQYIQEDGVWTKLFDDNGILTYAGPVVSEKVLSELGE